MLLVDYINYILNFLYYYIYIWSSLIPFIPTGGTTVEH